MSDGLITRIGKWIDNRWEAKATVSELETAKQTCQERHIGALQALAEIGDLKTRLEKIELYSGMTRKVDPTKAPVAKSAFSM